jgi:hypothetical protein
MKGMLKRIIDGFFAYFDLNQRARKGRERPAGWRQIVTEQDYYESKQNR